MARYIDADEFKIILERAMEKMHLICGVKAVSVGAVIEALNIQPTADVVPKSEGEWVTIHTPFYKPTKMICSNCQSLNGTRIKFNYCPNCGAKMKGGETDA